MHTLKDFLVEMLNKRDDISNNQCTFFQKKNLNWTIKVEKLLSMFPFVRCLSKIEENNHQSPGKIVLEGCPFNSETEFEH